MSKETIYPKGVRIFKPHGKAPDFVKGVMILTMNELVKFAKENSELLTEYNGEKQLRFQILDGKDGLYATVDTFKPENKPANLNTTETDDLPF